MGLLDAIAALVRAGYPEQTARKIATGELPMDTASRMARAADQGFNAKHYHGTRADILEFQPSTEGMQGPGIYSSSNPAVASSYAGKTLYEPQGGENVIPIMLRGGVDHLSDIADRYPSTRISELPSIYPALREEGITGLESGTDRVTFDPRDIRSYFSAAFDPDYTGPNILGGAAGTAALAGLLAAPQEAEAGTKSQAASEFISGVMGLIDPRYDKRVGSRDRMAQLTPGFESRGTIEDVPRISLSSLEGRDFITSMSDRTRGGGLLQVINDVELAYPINLQGGQDFMMENPGMVWASAHTPVHQIMREAGGENMLYLPFRMAPTGGDFAKMTGETMISYASANMAPTIKKEFDSAIRNYVTKGKRVKDEKTGESRLVGDGLSIKGWRGVDNPESIEAWRNTPDSVRKELMDMMDKRFRNKGGLAIGEARLAVSDPLQVGARDAGIQNVGEVFGGGDIIVKSGHPSYPYGVPGQGLGRLDEQPMSIFDLLPDARLGKEQRRVGDTVDPVNPSANDIRALQMKPYRGRIDEATLRRLEDRGVNVNSPAAINAGLMHMFAEDAHNVKLENMMRSIGFDRDPMYEYKDFLPRKQNIVTGETSFAIPEAARSFVRGLLDIGLTPQTGIYNPTALLDVAL